MTAPLSKETVLALHERTVERFGGARGVSEEKNAPPFYSLGDLIACLGTSSHLVDRVNMDEAAAFGLDGQSHGSELRIHCFLLSSEFLAFVDIAGSAVDLVGVMARPECERYLLVHAEVGKRLLEELV